MTPSDPHTELHPALDELAATLEGLPHTELLGMTGTSCAFVLARLLAENPAPLLILAASQEQAVRITADLGFYLGRPDQVFYLPHWEMRPYEALLPHPAIEATRLATLAALADGRALALVMTVRSVMQRVMPRRVLAGLRSCLREQELHPREALLPHLAELGYHAVPLVEDPGTFSVRGDLLDLYPPTLPEPVRIEFFGDQIERMRPFDPTTQRSREHHIASLELLPAREMILAGEHLETFARTLKQRADALGIARPQREALLEEAREGLLGPGHSFFMPLCYDGLDTIFDYVTGGRLVRLDPPAIAQEMDRLSDEISEGEHRMANHGELYLPGDALYLSGNELADSLALLPHIDVTTLRLYDLEEQTPRVALHTESNADLRSNQQQDGGLAAQLASRLHGWQKQNWRLLLVCHQQGQAERLQALLAGRGLDLPLRDGIDIAKLEPGRPVITLGELSSGFRLPDEHLAIITEEEIFGRRARRRSGAAEARAKARLSSLAELREGDLVVHADHGIGRYQGLQHLQLQGNEGDFLNLEYAGKDRLYLPVERIEKIQKYVGAEGAMPRLDRMGGGAWEKAKLKARAAVEELARELLQIYARREMHEGFHYSPPDAMFREFEAAFPYEETADQMAAINDVLTDMQTPRAMDRVICGDVGYGKTEVAIRAAYKAALDGKQVAVLVPTTILARQHGQTFAERLKDTPVTVASLSRLNSSAEQKQILQQAADGKIDILIGTHRLLQRDVRFKDLGLLIVDEEQRFGVTHKERLKKLRAEVDLLTLTATPIPRTLHMSLLGLRDLSVIDTPPVDRQVIRTYVSRFDDDLIRQAILNELRRGGQVFFVHNRVQNIGAMAEFIQSLVPEATVAVGHGQMTEKALEAVMMDFVEGKTNVLVCSTIIENGLDIPRANTIIVNRADCFGLAQLYQLRGRVGRSHLRAYAYLLIPGESTLTHEARERLRVLTELTELGAGFRIASHDLELRGAGDLLGPKQSGQIAAIGFEMYAELLEDTIAELKGQQREDRIDPEIRLGLSAFLPEKYLPDPNQRLVFYKQLASAEDEETLYDLADELRDRFGDPPDPTLLLMEVMKLRVLMKRLRIATADYDGHSLTFGFAQDTPVQPDKIIALLDMDPKKYSFSPDFRLGIRLGRQPGEAALGEAKKALQGLI
ncbi:transcription-repair coupling factor [Syntrophotalea carbinolica DSM 2380]|uniref:Transcription-repair-coupling factor n=1 Tax=Syntrophotalea carbinolica (strain DSM 2380 / NBRC 103641 / GraBd1) TaxID=338963 RepID=Q3A8D8_SYNC1|nr:transcription-repair coupling factor [Syntrophotalea carbinolica]ABA87354.1 transcription-repair coupling factor [Syntrophotalea carbinolica DSM 2380]